MWRTILNRSTRRSQSTVVITRVDLMTNPEMRMDIAQHDRVLETWMHSWTKLNSVTSIGETVTSPRNFGIASDAPLSDQPHLLLSNGSFRLPFDFTK